MGTPNYFSTPLIYRAKIDTANTNRDGSGAVVTVLDQINASINIGRIKYVALGATTAGFVRIFIYKPDDSFYGLYHEFAVPAVTPVVGTTPPATAQIDFKTPSNYYMGLSLPAMYKLKACTHISEPFDIIIEGASA